MTDEEVIAFVQVSFFTPAQDVKQLPMTEAQTAFLVEMMFADPAALDTGWQRGLADPQYEVTVIESVCRRFTARPVQAPVKFFLSQICRSPADAVMYLSFAQAEAAGRQTQESVLNLSLICDVFPLGFWSEADRSRLWNGQKLPEAAREGYKRPDNGLDDHAVVAWLNAPQVPRPERTRGEHLAWCKQRALAELDAPGLSDSDAIAAAFSSMASDLNKHSGTRNHLGYDLGLQLLLAGHLKTRAEMRRHIEGYN